MTSTNPVVVALEESGITERRIDFLLNETFNSREDRITVARNLRLTIVVCLLHKNLMTRSHAEKILNSKISSHDPSVYDDRLLLDKSLAVWDQYGTLDPNIIGLIDKLIE